jgi:hypothetical protein
MKQKIAMDSRQRKSSDPLFEDRVAFTMAQTAAIEDLLKEGFSKKILAEATGVPEWDIELMQELVFVAGDAEQDRGRLGRHEDC